MTTIDTRGMVPPEPFEKTIDALRTLPTGERLVILLDREPVPLFRFLVNNNYQYEAVWPTIDYCQVTVWET